MLAASFCAMSKLIPKNEAWTVPVMIFLVSLLFCGAIASMVVVLLGN